MIHLNGNLLCAIDVETTGLDPLKHEIIEICILPLDVEINPHKKVIPFHLLLKPEKIDQINKNAMAVSKIELIKCLNDGMDQGRAADHLDTWFDKLNLGFNKRLSPLAHNWPFDRAFLIEWLGPLSFDRIFDGRFRDTMACALYDNDVADLVVEQTPYPKVKLKYLASQLKIPTERSHRALEDCITTAEVYKRMMRRRAYKE